MPRNPTTAINISTPVRVETGKSLDEDAELAPTLLLGTDVGTFVGRKVGGLVREGVNVLTGRPDGT